MLPLYGLALVLLVAAGVSADDALPWWKTAIFYQVYPRSFMDSDGDGIGDLAGITDKADYLKEIGVTAIWISPIYKSPMKDFGYDVSDYRNIETTFGTLDDFRELVQKLHDLDIKLLLDLVPNHSSDQHVWFQNSIKRIDPYTDYYLWNDGKVVNGTRVPPNNWTSVFEKSMWQWNDKRQQYYLHQFLPEQPDLNYWNPAVIQEIDDLMHYWMDLGVDGFRVDAVLFICEDQQLRDEPPLAGTQGDTYATVNHTYTLNLPETYAIMNHFAEVVYNYSKKDGKERAMFLEGYTDLPHTFEYQGHGNLLLMQPFNFILVGSGDQGSRAEDLLRFINSWVKDAPADNINNWVMENHDNTRVPNKRGPEMVDPMNMLTGVLPGVKVVYYGEEIGMSDNYIRWDQTVDTKAINLGPQHFQEVNRDPERTPMQWDNSPNAGFSPPLTRTWLPVNPNYYHLNVAQQLKDPVSHLKTFMAIAEARKDPILQRGNVTVEAPNNDTLIVIRRYNGEHMVLVMNVGSEIINYTSANLFRHYSIDVNSTVVIASLNTGISPGKNLQAKSMSVVLVPKSAVLLRSVSASTPSSDSSTAMTTESPPSSVTPPGSSAGQLFGSIALLAICLTPLARHFF